MSQSDDGLPLLERFKKFLNKKPKETLTIVMLALLIILFILIFISPEKAHAQDVKPIDLAVYMVQKKETQTFPQGVIPPPAPPEVPIVTQNNTGYIAPSRIPTDQWFWQAMAMCDAKFGEGHREALVALLDRESGWNYLACNSSSGAYGLGQALPASKMASYGADYRTNPITQMAWCLDYIGGRYGNPTAANAFQRANNWY